MKEGQCGDCWEQAKQGPADSIWSPEAFQRSSGLPLKGVFSPQSSSRGIWWWGWGWGCGALLVHTECFRDHILRSEWPLNATL